MGIEKKVCSFRFDRELIEHISYYAKKQNRTLSNFVETILKTEIQKLNEAEENEKQQG